MLIYEILQKYNNGEIEKSEVKKVMRAKGIKEELIALWSKGLIPNEYFG